MEISAVLCKDRWGGTCLKKITAPNFDCGEGHVGGNIVSPPISSQDITPLNDLSTPMKEFKTREEKTDELLRRLSVKAQEFCGSEQWANYLNFFSGFRSYSANNILLAVMQKPNAKLLASYDAFAKKGRQVKKGEEAIWILAPLVYSKKIKEDVVENGETTSKEATKTYIKGFKAVPVFDISQTEGDEIPSPVSLLKGEAPERLEEVLSSLPEEIGFSISFEELEEGGPNGYCDFRNKKIVIKSSNEPSQRVKTIVHEMGHALLHQPEEGASLHDRCRGTSELEAESVAYVVCNYLGIDSSDYSFGYLASWTNGDKDKVHNEIQKSATRIKGASDKILDLLSAKEEARQLV
jgi:antirestriction protein ArdC